VSGVIGAAIVIAVGWLVGWPAQQTPPAPPQIGVVAFEELGKRVTELESKTAKVPASVTDPAVTARVDTVEKSLAALRADPPLPLRAWPLSNDLQRTVCLLYPAVARALDALRDAGAVNPLMTGSGSTCYALFAHMDNARQTYERLSGVGGWTALTSTASAVSR